MQDDFLEDFLVRTVRAALVAHSKTSFTPSLSLAEHSIYL